MLSSLIILWIRCGLVTILYLFTSIISLTMQNVCRFSTLKSSLLRNSTSCSMATASGTSYFVSTSKSLFPEFISKNVTLIKCFLIVRHPHRTHTLFIVFRF